MGRVMNRKTTVAIIFTQAEVVLVAVNDQGRPVPIRPEPMQA